MDIRRILVPTDGSQMALKALAVASDLARLKRADMLVLHVRDKPVAASSIAGLEAWAHAEHADPAQLLEDLGRAVVDKAASVVREAGVNRVETMVRIGDPTRAIVETAREHDVDAIVMGSRGLGDLEGWLLGSVSHKVTHLAPCTCIVVR